MEHGGELRAWERRKRLRGDVLVDWDNLLVNKSINEADNELFAGFFFKELLFLFLDRFRNVFNLGEVDLWTDLWLGYCF
jgi:hypothetical protein